MEETRKNEDLNCEEEGEEEEQKSIVTSEEKDLFDEEVEDAELRKHFKMLIKYDDDFVKGFSDMMSNGQLERKVEKKLDAIAERRRAREAGHLVPV